MRCRAAPRSIGEVDRGPQRAPRCRRPGPRRTARRRGRGDERRDDARPARQADAWTRAPIRRSRSAAPMFCRIIQTMIPGPYRFDACSSTSRSPRRTRRRTSPTGARGRSRPGCANGCSMSSPASWGSAAPRSGCATWSVPTSSRRRWSPVRPSTCACRPRPPSRGRSSSPTSNIGQSARRRRGQQGRCLGLGYRHLHRGGAGAARVLRRGHARACPRSSAPSRSHAVLEADGSVTVHTQQMPHGQGHETTLAQVAADELGVPIERRPSALRRHRDRAVRASRAPAAAGRRRWRAARSRLARSELREHIVDVAADLLEASPARPRRSTTGTFTSPACRRSSVTFPEVAAEAMRRGVVGDTDRLGRGEAIRSPGLGRRRGRLGAGHPRVLGRGRPRDRPGEHRPLRRRWRTAAS